MGTCIDVNTAREMLLYVRVCVGPAEIPWVLYFPLYAERAMKIQKLSRAGSGLIGLRLTVRVS